MKKYFGLASLLTGIALTATATYAAFNSESQKDIKAVEKRFMLPKSNISGWYDGYTVEWDSVSPSDSVQYSFVYSGKGKFYELTIFNPRGRVIILDKECDERVDRIVIGTDIYSRDIVSLRPDFLRLFQVSENLMSNVSELLEEEFGRKAGTRLPQ